MRSTHTGRWRTPISNTCLEDTLQTHNDAERCDFRPLHSIILPPGIVPTGYLTSKSLALTVWPQSCPRTYTLSTRTPASKGRSASCALCRAEVPRSQPAASITASSSRSHGPAIWLCASPVASSPISASVWAGAAWRPQNVIYKTGASRNSTTDLLRGSRTCSHLPAAKPQPGP